jgi:hypothetical protein
MILELFVLFTAIAFVMICLGLVKPDESAQALVGFLFLFLLAFTVILPGNLEYKTGEQTNYTYSDGNLTQQDLHYVYSSYNDSNTHAFGYWLSLVSVLGFIFVIMGIRRSKNYE